MFEAIFDKEMDLDIVNQDIALPVLSMSRNKLHELVRASSQRLLDRKLDEAEKKMVDITKCPSVKMDDLHKTMKAFKVVYKRKWLESNSTETRFLEKNKEWLSEDIVLPTGTMPERSHGRPSKEVGESSDRTKRRKTMELRKTVNVEQLTYAAQMSHRAAGNIEVAKVIQEVTKSPTRAKKFRKAAAIGNQISTKKHTPEDALSIYVDGNFTMAQYEVIYQANREVYPCYKYIQMAKQNCYPPKSVTETVAEVKLQDLVNLTTVRLCKYLEEVLEQGVESTDSELKLIYKWGCDGSTQSRYKQKFNEDGNSDANVFVSSLVPLRLISGTKIIWQNLTPSSPRFCRPIRIRYVKESMDVTNEEIDYVENQARNLEATKINANVSVNHVLIPTMVDGKVCNAATHTLSTLRCYICGKTSKSFNNLTVTNIENPDTFKFGLSILHARIRFFEFVLHLSYKLKAKVCKGRITVKSDRDKIEEAKTNMQKEFYAKMGLLVDIPKVGYGNTNDGNTSRRFFNDVEEAASITGVDLILIKNFKIILEVLSSGFDIDVSKFSKFTRHTAEHYVRIYPWQPMSPTVHKILIHSASVIKHALLPIGHLSEEAAEARNKHIRQYRDNFARKFSRVVCNEDVLNRLLLTSDPYISSIRRKVRKDKKSFSKEAVDFLTINDCIDNN